MSQKFLRDAVADWMYPGLPPGEADSDKRITWCYAQLECDGEEGVIVRIEM